MLKRKLTKLFYWSWIITLPLLSMGGYLTYRAIDRFYTFNVRYNPAPGNLDLAYALSYEYLRLVQRVRAEYYQLRGVKSELKTVEVFASQSDLSVLESYMPQSGFQYIKARIKNENKLEKAKIKYRGDYGHHWAFDKKSMRIKTSKKRLFEGLRAFNLQAPKAAEQLNNYLAYRLASKLGLVAPRTELVRLMLNSENRGVHILIEQLEELTLRRSGLMPSDVYRGEMVGKDAFLQSGVRNLFESAAVWDKISINNHYPADSKAPLKHLLALLENRNSKAAQAELSRFLDMEMWGRFSAFEALAQTKHYHNNHNWRLYYDPWRQKIIPIVWDPVGWPVGWRPKAGEAVATEIIEHKLHKTLFLNGDFIRARNQALRSFYRSGKAEAFLQFTSDTVRSLSREVYIDPLLRPANPNRVVNAMNAMESVIYKGFHDIKKQLGLEASQVEYDIIDNRLRLVVNGRGTVERLRINLNGQLKTLPRVRAKYLTENGDVTIDASGLLSIEDGAIVVNGGFLSDLSIVPSNAHAHSFKLRSKPGVYEIEFGDINIEGSISGISADLGEGFMQISSGTSREFSVFEQISMPMRSAEPTDQVIWSGDVMVSGYRVIKKPVIIKPGTRILLDANAVLVFENRLTAKGTDDKPVQFISQSEGQAPWGAVVLNGPGADGSALTHCLMSGGSGYKSDLQEYTAMLSIHHVDNVVIKNCQFRDNKVVDDMVHAVYSKIHIEQSQFLRANSDALDIDISEAVIIDSVFEQSGNDAIDLMSSKAQVIGSLLEQNGDKGISVGEGSSLFAVDNVVKGNAIGIQSKDGSAALVINQTLINNKQSLHAYRKNWRYGDGGLIFVAKSKLLSSDTPISADKYSGIYLSDSFQDKTEEKKRVFYYQVDDKHLSKAVDSNVLPKHMLTKRAVTNIVNNVPAAVMSRINVSMRGALPNDYSNQKY